MAKKILIVDDEEDPRTYLTALFEDNGYETKCVTDGDEATQVVKDYMPDLITLDIIMERETGVKFYRWLQKDDELKRIPVIICSGVTQYKDLFSRDHKTMPKPFYFIEKPIDRQLMLDKVKKAVG